MKKPWRVRFQKFTRKTEEVRDFTTERKARKFYDRIKVHPYVTSCSIMSRLDETASTLVRLAIECLDSRKARKLWSKLKTKDQEEFSRVFKDAAAAICRELLQ